jgi:(p)ppGpp synthase/HD superfamily hydrolase
MPMRVALTNLDLYEQLHRAGHGEADLLRIRDSYIFAVGLFSDRFRASGKPFLAHLVGTASLVASFDARLPVVIAALLHAVYESGAFADGTTGPVDDHRRTVRERVGAEVEELVSAYHGLRWNAAESERIAGSIGRADARVRDVLLIRLANEIEDHLGNAMRLSGKGRTRYAGLRESCLAVARALGRPDIADALTAVYRDSDAADWAVALAVQDAVSFRVPGPSTLGGSQHLRLGVAAALRLLHRRPSGARAAMRFFRPKALKKLPSSPA